MANSDSPIDPRPLRQARALLAETDRGQSVLPVAGAAVLFAASALVLAVVVATLPPHWTG